MEKRVLATRREGGEAGVSVKKKKEKKSDFRKKKSKGILTSDPVPFCICKNTAWKKKKKKEKRTFHSVRRRKMRLLAKKRGNQISLGKKKRPNRKGVSVALHYLIQKHHV